MGKVADDLRRRKLAKLERRASRVLDGSYNPWTEKGGPARHGVADLLEDMDGTQLKTREREIGQILQAAGRLATQNKPMGQESNR